MCMRQVILFGLLYRKDRTILVIKTSFLIDMKVAVAQGKNVWFCWQRSQFESCSPASFYFMMVKAKLSFDNCYAMLYY